MRYIIFIFQVKGIESKSPGRKKCRTSGEQWEKENENVEGDKSMFIYRYFC